MDNILLIMEKANKIDSDLTVQSFVDRMYGTVYYHHKSPLSNDELIRTYQQQYGQYCAYAKSDIVENKLDIYTDPTSLYKGYVIYFIYKLNEEDFDEIRSTFELNKDSITSLLSILCYGAVMRVEDNFSEYKKPEDLDVPALETIAMTIGYYVYFMLLVSNTFNSKDFNKLFAETWMEFLAHYESGITRYEVNALEDQYKGFLFLD